MSKRVIILAGIIAALVAVFWLDSRYPALDAKAIMGGSMKLEDPLSFDATVQLQEDHGFVKRVTLTTYNWINTNLQGMTFGLLLGAAFISLINLIRHRIQFKNPLVNTLVGILTGAPLGVCVNCAAPIAKGMHDAGARLETSLATLISSPTLNIVVLTMMFTLFPFYVAVTKVAATFVLLLLFIPLIVRFGHPAPSAVLETPGNICGLTPPPDTINETWLQAVRVTLVDYLKSLRYIIVKAVPLMLLAGLLGAIAITLLPLESIIHWPVTVLGMIAVALFGVFLPVPIAFDIIVSATLLAAGMPMSYVMILLFTLGSFSIYSFSILWRSVSARVAVALYLSVAVIGIGTGFVAKYYYDADLKDMMDFLIQDAEADELTGDMANIELAQVPLAAKSPLDRLPFTLMEGREVGLDLPNSYSVSDFLPPYYMGRGIAAGDYNNDGWQDIVVASKNGIVFYQNQQGKRFERQAMPGGDINDFDSFVVALVDINNDGWLDVYFTSMYRGNFYLLNEQGQFDFARLQDTPTKNNVLTFAMAFGDIDKDGDLDAVVGNWIFALEKRRPPKIAGNAIHTMESGTFVEKIMNEQSGETLSILLSDYTGDGNLDLVIGNDFDVPDFYYIGDGAGGFDPVTRQSGLIAISTDTTMSIDSADIDNDLNLDLYLSQIAPGAPGRVNGIKSRERLAYCDDLSEGPDKQVCLNNLHARNIIKYGAMHKASSIAKCKAIADQAERKACMAINVAKTASQRRKPDLCHLIPESQALTEKLCDTRFLTGDELAKDMLRKSIPISMNQNVLLQRDHAGNFSDQAKAFGVDQSAWSWNAKFADLDNDQWQDIYVVNGIWIREESVPSAMFFRNREGKVFEDLTIEYGFEHYMIDTAYVYIDYDNDGDLDIAKTSINGPLFFYRNNEQSNQAIEVSIKDELGNHFGIGSKIVIRYGPGKTLQQVRELKAGGGYTSFDPPVAHFGLGDYQQVEEIEVFWSTGESSKWVGHYSSGQHYTLTRKRPFE